MAFNKKVGRGSLGKSKRAVDGGPGYNGSITLDMDIPAGTKLWLAAWLKTGDDGHKYFSIVIEEPQQQQREIQRPAAPQRQPDPRYARQDAPQYGIGGRAPMDDEIPF